MEVPIALPLAALAGLLVARLARAFVSGAPPSEHFKGLFRYNPGPESAPGVREEVTAPRWRLDERPGPAPREREAIRSEGLIRDGAPDESEIAVETAPVAVSVHGAPRGMRRAA